MRFTYTLPYLKANARETLNKKTAICTVIFLFHLDFFSKYKVQLKLISRLNEVKIAP